MLYLGILLGVFGIIMLIAAFVDGHSIPVLLLLILIGLVSLAGAVILILGGI